MSARSAARDLFGIGGEHPAELSGHDHDSPQQQLREREELLRLAVEATGLGIWDMELPSGRSEWSLKLRTLAGLDPASPIDDDLFYALVHPDDRDNVAAALERAVSSSNREPYGILYRIFRIDTGEERWFHEWSRLVLDPSGKPARVVGAIEDVTERKRAELERQASEKRWALGLSAARMVAWEHDPGTGSTSMSTNAADLLGYVSGDISDFLDHVHPDERVQLAKLLSDASPERTSSIEYRFRREDGRHLWLQTSMTSISDGALTRVVGVTSDITERREAEKKLRYAATHDSMTGLLNRAALQAALEQRMSDDVADHTRFTLAIVDVDDFKDTNDTLGHDAGDCLIRFVAGVLRDVTKTAGTVARLGGDEFAVLVDHKSADEFRNTFGSSIQSRLREGYTYDGKTRSVAASLGLASFPEHASTTSELLKAADLALYAAKRDGRAQVNVFKPELLERAQQRAAVLTDVRRALLQGEFLPFYQPKIDLASGKLVGFEALARWQHPAKGILGPQVFGMAFEDCEMAAAIGRAMLSSIVRDMQSWNSLEVQTGRISLNLSSYDFADEDLATTILNHLARGDIPPETFEIEVTETVLLDGPHKKVTETLETLHDAGIKISLDDFGTGFSSLTHLKRFTVDELKIDRSFISNIVSDENDSAIVEGLIGLAKALKLTVIAEGIETHGQVERLLSIGCGYGQGYFFSKPMIASRVPWFVAHMRDQQVAIPKRRVRRG